MKQYPDTVTIRTPMHTPLLRGAQAARGPHAMGPLGDNIRVRMSKQDRELVEYMCAQLGMKKAEFVRWCALEVAQQLRDL